jgi:ABC-type branched-subunit amino acid transport system permease subunit
MLLSAAAAAAVLLPMPVILPPYPLIVLCYALVFAIACMGLNLLFGTTGLLSFGHATYFGTAAYAGAFLYRFSPVNSFELYLLFGLACSVAWRSGRSFIPCSSTGPCSGRSAGRAGRSTSSPAAGCTFRA